MLTLTQQYERIRELRRKNLPHATFDKIFKITEGSLSEDEIKLINDYLYMFVQPSDAGCVHCGEKQGGDILEQMLGTIKFHWGIPHGEGFCTTENCGWPARAYHYDVGPIKRFNAILQFHPDVMKLPEDTTEQEMTGGDR
jgi:hypothetical protein